MQSRSVPPMLPIRPQNCIRVVCDPVEHFSGREAGARQKHIDRFGFAIIQHRWFQRLLTCCQFIQVNAPPIESDITEKGTGFSRITLNCDEREPHEKRQAKPVITCGNQSARICQSVQEFLNGPKCPRVPQGPRREGGRLGGCSLQFERYFPQTRSPCRPRANVGPNRPIARFCLPRRNP